MKTGTTTDREGNPFDYSLALQIWAAEGLPVLEEVARSYGAYVTYGELSERLQDSSGIHTGVPFRHWIGPVLGEIAKRQQEREKEPILTALVVRADGSVGDGYSIPLQQRGIEIPADLDAHAAAERFRCYQYFGATLPADGGKPQLTKKVAERRSKLLPVKAPRSVCQSCFIQIPLSGICDNCGSTA
jgi:hypothetical protein